VTRLPETQTRGRGGGGGLRLTPPKVLRPTLAVRRGLVLMVEGKELSWEALIGVFPAGLKGEEGGE